MYVNFARIDIEIYLNNGPRIWNLFKFWTLRSENKIRRTWLVHHKNTQRCAPILLKNSWWQIGPLKWHGLEKKLFPYESNRLVDLEIGDLLKFFILKFRENSKKLQRVNEKHHSVSKVNWCLSQSLWKMVRGTELCALFIIDCFFSVFLDILLRENIKGWSSEGRPSLDPHFVMIRPSSAGTTNLCRKGQNLS